MAKINANLVVKKTVCANVIQSMNMTAESKTLTPITRNYTGLSNESATVVVDNGANTIEVNLIKHSYASRFNFPNIGEEAVLYIDELENKTYRFSCGELKYYCVGSDYADIKTINGGNAENGECNTEQ